MAVIVRRRIHAHGVRLSAVLLAATSIALFAATTVLAVLSF